MDYGWIAFGAIVVTIIPILGLIVAAWAASKREVKDYLRFGAGLLAVAIAGLCGWNIWVVGDSLSWCLLPLAILALVGASKIMKIGLREVRYS